jgi:hypothetical protein
MAEYNEPEEKGGFNPLEEKVNEKPYSKLNVTTNPEELSKPIGEPFFTPPPMNEDVQGDKAQHTNKGNNAKPQQEAFNPSMNEIPNAEKSRASEHVAGMIMQGYEFANQLANKGLMFSEKRLLKLQQEGEIDFANTYVPYDMNGNVMPATEFIQDYNSQQDGAFKVTDEFKQEVTPVLKRVLEKRGVGMTDEQFLMYMFGKDIAMKGFMFFSARAQMNQMIQLMKEMNQNGKGASQPAPQPKASTYSSPVNDYVPEPEEDVDLDLEIEIPESMTVNEEVERMTNPDAFEAAKAAKASMPKSKGGRKPKRKL